MRELKRPPRTPWFYNPFLVIFVILAALWLFRALAFSFASP